MTGVLVACLCADWCDTCRKYRVDFEALRRDHPEHRFIWIDIENDADLVADIEVENFPTLLIASAGGDVLFAGTMLPHIGQLKRLLQEASSAGLSGRAGLAALEKSRYESLARQLLMHVP